jgi:predicted short-subunit dehydrogenase-like oxidoreductase (DUF2520 family)
MRIVLVGPGRAGQSLARRAAACGHRIVGVLARSRAAAVEAGGSLGTEPLEWENPLPACDLLVVAVRDDAIADVARRLAPHAAEVGAAVHLSGLTPVGALVPLGAHAPCGSFHPLQTLPEPETGARLLEGAWVAVTSENDLLTEALCSFAGTIGMHPFEIDDDCKALYHAGAAAAANFSLAALIIAEQLLTRAGVPLRAAEPLVRAVVDNAFRLGPAAALTGPIARGDVGTVRAQIEAIEEYLPGLGDAFRAMGRATARVAGTIGQVGEALG